MRTYQMITGRTLDLTGADTSTIRFLKRLMAMAPASTHDQMIGLAYGTQNPIMDVNAIPGRGAVTAEILGTPAYRAMTDVLFRKQLAESGTSVEELASQFTMTPAEVAARLGVHVSAIRQAIDAAAWAHG